MTPTAFDDITEVLDLDRYPVHDLASPAGRALIDRIKDALARDGASSLPGFLRPQAVAALLEQVEPMASLAHPGPTEVSPYFFDYDIAGPDVPDEHPTRFKGARRVSQVAYDLVPRDSLLSRLYHSDLVTNLVAGVQNKDRLYRLADRYQSLNISFMEPGGCQQWHFDRGKLATTLLLQAAEAGGVFEYVPDLRSDEDENFDDVAQVLAGDRSRIRRIEIEPGTLNLFRGHYSMHRVTEVRGSRRRIQTIFAFADEPDKHGNLKSSILHYGQRVARLEGVEAEIS